MTKPLRLAMVGCGDIGGWIARLARLNRHIRLAACCDRTLPVAEQFAARHKIPCAYGDYRKMFEGEELDAAYLAVPHDLHLEMTRAAVEAGLHVLLEKPLAHTPAEGKEIVRLAEQAAICVGVNYQYRYDPGCYALAMAARQGDLGALYYGRCNVPWQRESAYFEHGPWRGQAARAGGGTLLTQGSHALDVLLWAMDSPPQTASGMSTQFKFPQVEVEDTALGMVELENGALIQISSSMAAKPEQPVTFELYGERGTALYRTGTLSRVRFRGVRVKRQRPPAGGLHPLQRSLAAFNAWVVEGRPYLTPAVEALPVLAAVEALYRSARSGQREVVG